MLTKSIIALALFSVGLAQASQLPDDASGQPVDLSSIALKREPHHHKHNTHPKPTSGKREPHHHHSDHPEHVNGKREPRHHKHKGQPKQSSGKREPGAIKTSLHRPDHPSLGGKHKREPAYGNGGGYGHGYGTGYGNGGGYGSHGRREPLPRHKHHGQPKSSGKREPSRHGNGSGNSNGGSGGNGSHGRREPLPRHKHYGQPKSSGKREPSGHGGGYGGSGSGYGGGYGGGYGNGGGYGGSGGSGYGSHGKREPLPRHKHHGHPKNSGKREPLEFLPTLD